MILALRRELREKSELGECGARAIHRTMQDRGYAAVPCVRTTVDLDEDTIDFHALSRKEPDHQPLLATRKYHFPRRPFMM